MKSKSSLRKAMLALALVTGTLGPLAPAQAQVNDLVAGRIEVTQGIQDLNNSVRLVMKKRTFVRFHVRATMPGIHSATATLCLGPTGAFCFSPMNPGGYINVPSNPSRAFVNHSFLFEVPTFFTFSTSLKMTARIITYSFLESIGVHDPLAVTDANPYNNEAATTVSFESVPMQQLITYGVSYKVNDVTYATTPSFYGEMIHRWVKAAYPFPDLLTWPRQLTPVLSGQVKKDKEGNEYLASPSCGTVNAHLFTKSFWDQYVTKQLPAFPRKYYGMVSDQRAFMRGCSGVPSATASGPVGMPDDYHFSEDGAYAGHELGHAYGRSHVNACNPDPPFHTYPHPRGEISPAYIGDKAIYGFQAAKSSYTGWSKNWNLYYPWNHDVMTYCRFQWMSDFTYEGIMTSLQSPFPPSGWSGGGGPAGPPAPDGAGALFVVGVLDRDTNELELLPTVRIPGGWTIEPAQSEYSVVLRNSRGAEVAQPIVAVPMGSSQPGSGEPQNLVLLRALVPLSAGTTQLRVEGPNGQVLASVGAGAAPPELVVNAPQAGETVSGDRVRVAWSASDPNGDALRFNVDYSRDGGQNWDLVAQDVTDQEVTVDRSNLMASSQGLFRVWATDGINTGIAQSGQFQVANRAPTVSIVSPEGSPTILGDQTLRLEADAIDVDGGSMIDSQVRWVSDRDGELGNGAALSVSQLSAGTHVIRVEANDGMGGFATDSVSIKVVATIAELATVPDEMLVGPTQLHLDPAAGLRRHEVTIANQNPANPFGLWVAITSAPWVRLGTLADAVPPRSGVSVPALGAEAGLTPGVMTVSVGDTSGMGPGTYHAEIAITMPAFGSEPFKIPVTLTLS